MRDNELVCTIYGKPISKISLDSNFDLCLLSLMKKIQCNISMFRANYSLYVFDGLDAIENSEIGSANETLPASHPFPSYPC